MPKKLGSAIEAAKGRGESKLQSTKQGRLLSEIRDRPHGDTRPLNSDHVQELADNIAAVGLIQPLAVDSKGHLLAGGHRRAALILLKQTNPERFSELFPDDLIPTKAFDFDAADNPERAISIEAAENEKRRDYTPAEVRGLADKLVEAGYRNTKGKPRKGQKALTPALSIIIGKSQRTVKRYLAGDDKGTSVPLSTEAKLLKMLEKFELETQNESAAALATQLRELLEGQR